MAIKVLSNITVPEPRADDDTNNISYGTDAATRGYVDSNSGGSGGVSGVDFGLEEWTPNFYDSNDFVIYDGKIYYAIADLNSTETNYTPDNYPSTWKELTPSSLAAPPVGVSQTMAAYRVTSNNKRIDLELGITHWYLDVYPRNTGNNSTLIYSATLKLPSVSGVDSDSILTYEMQIHCRNKTNDNDDNNSVVLTLNGATLLGNGSVSLTVDRGHNYFIVFRNFPADESNTRQWIANIQGKVEIPTSP